MTTQISMRFQLGLRITTCLWLLLLLMASTLYTATATQVLLETMASNSIKPWTGTGCDNPWTLTFSGGNPFEQATQWNYGAGNPCGMQFKQGTANLFYRIRASR